MKWLDSAGFHGNNPILILQNAFNHQKRIVNNNRVVFFEKLRRDDDIRDSGFVLHAEKYKPFGSARTLTNDHCACYPHQRTIVQFCKIRCWGYSAAIQLRTMRSHRMRANR